MTAPNLAAFQLGSRTITTALSDVIITEGTSATNVSRAFWDRLAGINGLTLIAAFTYGSSGTTAVVTVDTALGAGGVWTPVARFDFATTTLTKQLVLSRTGIASAASLSTPSADAAINLLGDRFRARLTTTGTYAGGTLIDLRAQPHA
jgi:hypothetical protein